MGRSLDNFNREEHAERKMLGQITPPSSDTPVEIYSPGENIEARGVMITVTNDSNQDRTATVYFDNTGVTYDNTTRISQRTVTKGNESDKAGLLLAMSDLNGSLAVESSTGGDLTFTIWGIEIPKK